jgi:hypothetical protein
MAARRSLAAVAAVCATAAVAQTATVPAAVAQTATVPVSIDWTAEVRPLTTEVGFQTVVNPLITRDSPIHDAV